MFNVSEVCILDKCEGMNETTFKCQTNLDYFFPMFCHFLTTTSVINLESIELFLWQK